MNKKIFILFFVISILAILFLEDSMIKHFSLIRFGILFGFISLPFIFAYFLGWIKGFGISILISGILLFVVTWSSGGMGVDDGGRFLANVLLALVSAGYFTFYAIFLKKDSN